jgi:hypothetical protein
MGFLSFFETIKFTDEIFQDEFFQKCLCDIRSISASYSRFTQTEAQDPHVE